MLVCWEWLSQYVELSATPDDLALQFAMSGLNHESTTTVGKDTVIDLEVTSNRGDCLGHIGVAREAAVLLEQQLVIPTLEFNEGTRAVTDDVTIENRFTEGCPEYSARIIRGVKVSPSPEWLVRRLASIGIKSVNNVVDATNYVMMECGQPLHAFDLRHIRQGKIVIRKAEEQEKFLAIDHKTYELDSKMVVIADGERAIALGGVMGGAESEVSSDSTDLLIEAARFQPLAIRRAARKLKLHSPASYRFERGPDAHGLDWASARCCQLIMELAGGELSAGVARDGETPQTPAAIGFRLAQIPRVIGIDIPQETVVKILTALGCEVTGADPELSVLPPTWRNDLTREVDLLEEVARIYGYDQIPEDVAVPIGVAQPRPKDIALQRVRHVLSAYGIDEAMTPSVVSDRLEQDGSVWSQNPALATDSPLLKGAKFLRRGLTHSLLAARELNYAQTNRKAQLFEVANVYLPGGAEGDLPTEQSTLGIIASGDLRTIQGIVESIVAEVIGQGTQPQWSANDCAIFEPGSGGQLSLGEKSLGFVGIASKQVQVEFSLDQPVGCAELNLDALTGLLTPVRTADAVSSFPEITRDLNFVVTESLQWAKLSAACRAAGGDDLTQVEYQETYRDEEKDGPGRKRVLLTLHFQRLDRTLTGDEVDRAVESIIAQCASEFEAKLLG